MFEATNHEGSFHNNETISFFFVIRTCPTLTHTYWSLGQMEAQTCITKHLFKNMFMKVESAMVLFKAYLIVVLPFYVIKFTIVKLSLVYISWSFLYWAVFIVIY